jgi:hypothetical protein
MVYQSLTKNETAVLKYNWYFAKSSKIGLRDGKRPRFSETKSRHMPNKPAEPTTNICPFSGF